MQTPTLQGVRIRSTRDALLVFHAVAIKRLPLITRRLDAEERRSIVSGNVYVWYVVYIHAIQLISSLYPGRSVEPTLSPPVLVWKDGIFDCPLLVP